VIAAFRHLATLVELRRGLVARFVATSLGRSACSLLAILLVREFLNGVIGDGGGISGRLAAAFGPATALWGVALALFACYLGASLLAYDNQVTQQRMVKALELGMMRRLLHHLFALPVAYFDRQSHGDLLQAVRQDVTEIRAAVFAVGRIVLDGLTALGLVGAALLLSPRLTFWSLVVLPLAAIPVMLAARRALRRSREVRRTGYVLFDAILQALGGIRIIKVFGGAAREADETLAKGQRYFDELIEMVRIRSAAQVLLESIASLGIVLVIVIGGFDVMAGRLEWPALLAFLLAVRALHGPLNNINQGLVSLGTHGASAERVSELLATAPHGAALTGARPLPVPFRELALERVGFGYDDREVLRGVTFTVRAGETIGIAGPSGSGKTTLLNLLARFHDPTSGAITIDGVPLAEIRLGDLYENLAVVLQVPFLFATTVRENIRCGRPEASDAEVESAAEMAGIHAEITAMADGYDTVVGLGGTGVSVGQAQRINIARALLKNPTLLLLDEATSALDSLAEEKVQAALDRLMAGRTTFVVAHRLSTLRGASRVIVLEHGAVVGMAPHGELLEDCSLYQRMWQLQTMAVEASPPPAAAVAPLPPEEFLGGGETSG